MAMNFFRFAGDMSHLLSFLVLMYQLWRSRRAAGVSLKTQELYLIVFCTRYLDLLTPIFTGHAPRFDWWMMIYLYVMKLFFIGATATIVWAIRGPLNATYHKDHDTYKHFLFAILPAFVVACIINPGWDSITWWHFIREVFWAFSIVLESIAILPQLIVLQRHQDTSNITIYYIASLGLYRGLYVLNWIWRYWTEDWWDWIAFVFGVIQTLLYTDFFIQYRYALRPLLPTAVGAVTGRKTPASVAKLFGSGEHEH